MYLHIEYIQKYLRVYVYIYIHIKQTEHYDACTCVMTVWGCPAFVWCVFKLIILERATYIYIYVFIYIYMYICIYVCAATPHTMSYSRTFACPNWSCTNSHNYAPVQLASNIIIIYIYVYLCSQIVWYIALYHPIFLNVYTALIPNGANDDAISDMIKQNCRIVLVFPHKACTPTCRIYFRHVWFRSVFFAESCCIFPTTDNHFGINLF